MIREAEAAPGAPKTRAHKTPAMQRRTALIEAMAARGHAYSNLWLAQSVKADHDWILPSDAEYFHFLFLEFGPDVRSFDLAPPEVIVRVGDDDTKTRFDAIVDLVNGRRECHEVKVTENEESEDVRAVLQREAQIRACERFGGSYVRVYGDVLARQRHRWLNSARMLRCIYAAEGYATQQYRNACGSRLLRSSDGVPLRELIAMFQPQEEALVQAAVFRLLNERLVQIDIDSAPVSPASMVRLAS